MTRRQPREQSGDALPALQEIRVAASSAASPSPPGSPSVRLKRQQQAQQVQQQQPAQQQDQDQQQDQQQQQQQAGAAGKAGVGSGQAKLPPALDAQGSSWWGAGAGWQQLIGSGVAPSSPHAASSSSCSSSPGGSPTCLPPSAWDLQAGLSMRRLLMAFLLGGYLAYLATTTFNGSFLESLGAGGSRACIRKPPHQASCCAACRCCS